MLLRGPSGVGKSDLALRAAHSGWRLVADDRVAAWRSGERLFGRAPAPLLGLIEARGQAILRLAPRPFASIDLVVDLVGADREEERMPEPQCADVAGVTLPRVRLRAGEASTLARLALALQAHAGPAAKAPL